MQQGETGMERGLLGGREGSKEDRERGREGGGIVMDRMELQVAYMVLCMTNLIYHANLKSL